MEPVTTSLLSKEEHYLVHCCWIDILCEVLVACMSTLSTYTATSLLAEFRQSSTLDVAKVTYCDNNRVVRIEVFSVKLMFVRDNLCTTSVAIFLLNFIKLILHNLLAKFWIAQNLLKVCNLTLQLLIFCMKLIYTQTCELRQTHIYDSLRLDIVNLKTLLQVNLCLAWSLACTNDVYHLVDVVASDNQSFKDMSTFLSLTQFVLSTTDSYVMTMFNEVFNTFYKSKSAWTSLNQSDAIHRE